MTEYDENYLINKTINLKKEGLKQWINHLIHVTIEK